ncbi:MAG TPA: armadillo/beta-catenin-like repeat-containing protein [Pyrinomonadaceae bacterium]|nr:armadillo/beta-catenin-like repeat-containing protein [Pyrinomonadaceae bacterium]
MEITSSNPVVRAITGGTAPRPAQVAASRGVLPLPQADLLEILVHLVSSDDAELRENAAATLRDQDNGAIIPVLSSPEAPTSVLVHFATQPEMPAALHEAVIANNLTPSNAIAKLARIATTGSLLELISLNQQLLIREPAIIDAIIANPNRTAEAERRASETKREFFEKERGAEQIASELRAQGKEAAAEFIEKSEFAEHLDEAGFSTDDALFLASHIEVLDKDTDDSWLGLEFIEEIYEETEAQRKATLDKILGEIANEEEEVTGDRISMINRVMKMGVKDRVKLGMKGDREARNILIRDPNKLVSSAVINNPKITEQEVEMVATMKSVSEDILRQIAMNRQWGRSYTISLNLAKNPRTPLANSMTIMSKLQLRDLVGLSKDRNVPEAVRRHATRLLAARTGKG